MNNKEIESRLIYLDHAKAYGIIAIMSWHLHQSYFLEFNTFAFFVLPLFFFVSGLFSKILPWREFFLRELNRLFIPLAIFTVIYVVSFCALSFIMPESYLLHNLTDKIIDPLSTINGPLWFLWALFFVDLFYNMVGKLPMKLGGGIFLLIFLAGFYMRSINIMGHPFRLPLKMDVAMTASIFYVIAGYTRNIWINKNKYVTIIGLLIIPLYLLISAKYPYANGSFFQNYYTAPMPQFLILSFLGIVSILSICSIVSLIVKSNYIGRNTLQILGLHYIFVQFYLEIVPKFMVVDPVGKYIGLLLFIVINVIIVLVLGKPVNNIKELLFQYSVKIINIIK